MCVGVFLPGPAGTGRDAIGRNDRGGPVRALRRPPQGLGAASSADRPGCEASTEERSARSLACAVGRMCYDVDRSQG